MKNAFWRNEIRMRGPCDLHALDELVPRQLLEVIEKCLNLIAAPVQHPVRIFHPQRFGQENPPKASNAI
jgi:hypothetical protein